jgi:hypothetical protein
MILSWKGFGLAVLMVFAVSGAAMAQSVKNPVIRLTAQAVGTVNSLNQNNNYGGAVVCVFTQTAHTLSPSTTFSIQGVDPGGSGQFFTIITSAAVTADNTPTPLSAGKGVGATANVSATLPVPPGWRASVTIGGTGTVTGTVGCSLG